MTKQIQDAYIVAATRTPVGKAPRGAFRNAHPADLLAHVLKSVVAQAPGIDTRRIDDVIIGCAMPEGEQGMNVARIGALLAGLPDSVAAQTINRFCSSGLQAVALAADKIRLGESDLMLAGGVESMSMVPMMGNKVAMTPSVFENEHVAIAYGMGITAEKVAEQWKVSREDQDAFALVSHQRALAAIANGEFASEISPYKVIARQPVLGGNTVAIREILVRNDEGPRADTSADGLAPIARFVGFAVAGVKPEVMGIGPKEAIPKALKQAGLTRDQIDWIELNEAFAAQALAVIRDLGLDPDKVNPLGGAIALGHPLGATGAVRVATLTHGLQRRKQKYGMVTMCIGTGMGAAGIFESL